MYGLLDTARGRVTKWSPTWGPKVAVFSNWFRRILKTHSMSCSSFFQKGTRFCVPSWGFLETSTFDCVPVLDQRPYIALGLQKFRISVGKVRPLVLVRRGWWYGVVVSA